MDKGKHKAHIRDTEVLFSSFLVLLQRMEFTFLGGYHADSGQVYTRLSSIGSKGKHRGRYGRRAVLISDGRAPLALPASL